MACHSCSLELGGWKADGGAGQAGGTPAAQPAAYALTAASHTALCLDCLAAGVVVPGRGHARDEGYRLVQEAGRPLLCEGWGADEELRLLDTIERLGCARARLDTRWHAPLAPS